VTDGRWDQRRRRTDWRDLDLHLHLRSDAAGLQPERLIGSLVGVSRGLAISVFLLAIIFTGAILTPTTFSIPREYIVIFALAPLVMLVFAIRKEVTTTDAIVLILLFVVWIAYVAVRESRRETPTFRDLEIIEEAEEQEEEAQQSAPATTDPIHTQAVDTMTVFEKQGRRWSGDQPRPGRGGDLRDHHRRGHRQRGKRPDRRPLRNRGHRVRRHRRHPGAVDRGPLPHRATDPPRRARDRHRQRHRQPHLLSAASSASSSSPAAASPSARAS
jgi:Ca2+/Na+ antiporter